MKCFDICKIIVFWWHKFVNFSRFNLFLFWSNVSKREILEVKLLRVEKNNIACGNNIYHCSQIRKKYDWNFLYENDWLSSYYVISKRSESTCRLEIRDVKIKQVQKFNYIWSVITHKRNYDTRNPNSYLNTNRFFPKIK